MGRCAEWGARLKVEEEEEEICFGEACGSARVYVQTTTRCRALMHSEHEGQEQQGGRGSQARGGRGLGLRGLRSGGGGRLRGARLSRLSRLRRLCRLSRSRKGRRSGARVEGGRAGGGAVDESPRTVGTDLKGQTGPDGRVGGGGRGRAVARETRRAARHLREGEREERREKREGLLTNCVPLGHW